MLNSAEQILSVERQGRLPAQTCYRNVQQTAIEQGGDIVYGWMLEWMPNVYIQAMHHAVWRNGDGELIDLTKPQNRIGADFGKTSFVLDDRIKVDLNLPLPVQHRHLLLAEDDDLKAWIKQYIKTNELHRQLLQKASKDPRCRRIGDRFDDYSVMNTFPREFQELKDAIKQQSNLGAKVMRKFAR